MNKSEITFSANEQSLIKTGGIDNYASNTVSYIEATFTLGENWTGFDSVRAVWESYCAKVATVLDSNYKCRVPAEVLKVKSKVNVNLVGSIVEGNELTDRLTTYPIQALIVDANARVEGDETTAVTPSQFEQFVERVHDDAQAIQDYSYDSEAWAKGTRGGVEVPSTDETYHNNSKYYADQGATLQQEVTDLKSDLNGEIAGIITKANNTNLFNKADTNSYQVGKALSANDASVVDYQNMCTTDFIKIESGVQYAFLGAVAYYGTSSVVKVHVYKASDKSFLAFQWGTLNSSTNVVSFAVASSITTDAECFVKISFLKSKLNEFMFVQGDYPSEYVPYINPELRSFIVVPQVNVVGENLDAYKNKLNENFGSIEKIGFIEKPDGMNLKDVYNGNLMSGKWWNPNSNTLADDDTMCTVKIKIDTSKTYSFLGEKSYYGSANVIKVAVLNLSGNFLGDKSGLIDDSTNIITLQDFSGFTNDPECYVYYSFKIANQNAFFVEGVRTSVAPIKYYLSDDISIKNVDNPLQAKTAVFLGDSICAGQTVPQADTDYYGYGWAGRIGTANKMTWLNLGVNGASITRMSGRSCIVDRLSQAYAAHPNADYFIFEGGTNDADVISQNPDLYSVGTVTESDFTGPYDMSSFCGSLESFIKDIINKYPEKKIGYIIPMKMGTAVSTLTVRNNVFDKARQICKKWGVRYIDLWNESVMNPMLSEYYDSTKTPSENIASGKAYCDGQHPSDVGYDIITPQIEQWMKLL